MAARTRRSAGSDDRALDLMRRALVVLDDSLPRLRRILSTHRFSIALVHDSCWSDQIAEHLARSDVEEFHRLTDLQESFRIEPSRVSDLAALLSEYLVNQASVVRHLARGQLDYSEPLRNHLAKSLYEAVALELTLGLLLTDRISAVHCSSRLRSFRLDPRPELSLFRDSSGLEPVVRACTLAHAKDYHPEGSHSFTASAKSLSRSVLLEAYKACTIVVRSLRAYRVRALSRESGQRNPSKPTKRTVTVAVRAGSELESVSPLLEFFRTKAISYRLVVDDRIRFPDATQAVQATGEPWTPLHSYTRTREVLATLWRARNQRKRVLRDLRRIRHEANDNSDSPSVLGLEPFKSRALGSAMLSLPEVMVFTRQVLEVVTQDQPQLVVTMDTNNLYGGAVGAVGKARDLATITIQNAAIAPLTLPRPVQTDLMMVDDLATKQRLIRAGAAPKSVVALGLPRLESMSQRGDDRLSAERKSPALKPFFRVLIATQPIRDLCAEMLLHVALAFDPADKVAIRLRTHPRESEYSYTEIVDQLRSQGYSVEPSTAPLLDDLMDSDILVARTSTTLQTAVMAGVPSIAYLEGLEASPLAMPAYLDSNAITRCRTKSQLQALLSRFHGDPDYRRSTLEAFGTDREALLTNVEGCSREYTHAVGTRILSLLDRDHE